MGGFKKIIAVAVLKKPDGKEINFLDWSFQSMQAILEAGIKNTKAFLHMCEMSDKA